MKSLKKYRITKYNPMYRDARGAYMLDEWISISDVGNIFNGNLFTIEEYLNVEKKYIEACNIIMRYLNIRCVIVENVYKFLSEKEVIKNNNIELCKIYKKLQKDTKLYDINEINDAIKLRLREELAGFILLLKSKRVHRITFGYDYYMYLSTNEDITFLKKEIEQIGLYVEECGFYHW